MMKEMKSNIRKRNDLAEGMSSAGCGSKTVYDCKDAPAEGLKNYKNPLQGSAKDCSVIAALSSIVAVAPNRMIGSNLSYTFKSKVIDIKNKKLAVDDKGSWVYASSTGGSWPMLWEKAFAMLISNATITTRNCVAFPDIATAFQNGYAGLAALKEIGRYNLEVSDTVPFDARSGTLTWPAIATTKSSGFIEDGFWKLDHDYSVIKYNTTTGKYLIRNPCGGEEREVAKTDTHFRLWGHVEGPI